MATIRILIYHRFYGRHLLKNSNYASEIWYEHSWQCIQAWLVLILEGWYLVFYVKLMWLNRHENLLFSAMNLWNQTHEQDHFHSSEVYEIRVFWMGSIRWGFLQETETRHALCMWVLKLIKHTNNIPRQYKVRTKHGQYGRAIAQALSRRLPTTTPRVRSRFRSCGICGGQSGTGAGFLRVLRFPIPISFRRMFHIHHISYGAGTIDQ
jgi:hypothetical protein